MPAGGTSWWRVSGTIHAYLRCLNANESVSIDDGNNNSGLFLHGDFSPSVEGTNLQQVGVCGLTVGRVRGSTGRRS